MNRRLLVALLVLLALLIPGRALALSPCAAAVATVIGTLPGAETEHVPVTAEAIALAAPTPRRAALLIAIGYSESRFLPRIQAGDCRSFVVRGRWQAECDGEKQGREIVFKARTYWQMHELGPAIPVWNELLGLGEPNVQLAARIASRTIGRCLNLCKTDAGAASCYGTSHCAWRGGIKRGALAARLAPKLEACVR